MTRNWDQAFFDQRNSDGTINGWRAYNLLLKEREVFMGAVALVPSLMGRKGQEWTTSYMVAECLCNGSVRGDDKDTRQSMAREALSQISGGGHSCGIYMLGSWEELERQWIHGQERWTFSMCGSTSAVNVVARCVGGGALKIGTTGVLCETVQIQTLYLCKPRYTCGSPPRVVMDPWNGNTPVWACDHRGSREYRTLRISETLRILSQLGADMDPSPQVATGWPTESYK